MERTLHAGSKPDLAQELGQMFTTDVEVRNRIGITGDESALVEEMCRVDTAHTARMKVIIASYGWPGTSLVGEQGAEAAWLLVQHADRDVTFQRECLRMLETAVEQSEATRQHLAYLTDRVLVNEGKPQIYGTQFREGGPQAIEDEPDLDKRRLRMGLEPFEQYRHKMLNLQNHGKTDAELS